MLKIMMLLSLLCIFQPIKYKPYQVADVSRLVRDVPTYRYILVSSKYEKNANEAIVREDYIRVVEETENPLVENTTVRVHIVRKSLDYVEGDNILIQRNLSKNE